MKDNFFANISYILAGLVVFAIIYYSAPRMVIIPHGVMLPASMQALKNSEAYTGRNFRIYSKVPARSYQTLATINAAYHFEVNPNQDDLYETVSYAAHEARKIGANGLVIEQLGYTQPGSVPEVLQVYSLIAKAIKFNN